MAELSVQEITRSGLAPTYSAAASGGDSFPHGAMTFFHVKNGDTSSHDVTFASQINSAGQGLEPADLVVTIPDGGEKMIGPFSDRAFEDADGNVQVSYDATTSVTVAALTIG